MPNQSPNSFTGPPKVENVTFGRTRVVSNMIRQDISWRTVQLRNNMTNYIIKHKTSTMTATSVRPKVNSYTLKVKVPTFKTTLTVWIVAIRSNTPSSDDHGDPSDPQSITYTSMFSEDHLHLHATYCPPHPFVLHYSSWSTSRPDTCQQNLSQHHIPVVPT